MRRKFSLLCLLAAWICANGVVWDVVQVVGWARMFHDYAKVMPASQALKVALDGSRSCHFCEISQQAKDTAKQELPQDVLGGGTEKILLVAEDAPRFLLAVPLLSWPGLADEAGLSRTEKVPLPPPRVA